MDTISQLWSLIRQLQGVLKNLAGLSIALGAGTVNFTSPTLTSSTTTIPHGLAAVPKLAAAFSHNTSVHYSVITRDATNIVVQGDTASAGTSTLTFDWIAIG